MRVALRHELDPGWAELGSDRLPDPAPDVDLDEAAGECHLGPIPRADNCLSLGIAPPVVRYGGQLAGYRLRHCRARDCKPVGKRDVDVLVAFEPVREV